MKRLNLIIMMFAMVLVNTACDEKEEPTPTFKHIIELNELMGYWQHQSTKYMDDVITNCDELSASSKIPENKKGLIIFDLDIKPYPPGNINPRSIDGLCDWYVGCSSYISDGNDFILFDTENKIEIGNDGIYEILSYNKTTKELKIKQLEPNEYYVPVGAIFTLKKQ